MREGPMWKRSVVSVLLIVGVGACEDARVPTRPETQHVVPITGAAGPLLEVKFREDLRVRVDARGRLRSERGASLVTLQAVLDRVNVRVVRPLVTVPADKLAALVAEAQARSAEPVPDMLSWHHITLAPGADVDAALVE